MNGCDISEHQESFPDGAWDFVLIRVGTGEVPRADKRWFQHAQEARSRGIPAGAYWFADPSNSTPEIQAGLFCELMAARPGGWELLPWCDLEIGAITREWEQAFNSVVESIMGAAGTYASASTFGPAGPLAGSPWHRWSAAWSYEPPQPWDVWQTSGSPLDLDYAPSLDPIRLGPIPVPPIPPQLLDPEADPMLSEKLDDGTVIFWVVGRGGNVYRQVLPHGNDPTKGDGVTTDPHGWTAFAFTGAISADPEPTKAP